jgi:hypothetical protein
MLCCLEVEFLSLSESCVAVSSICAAPFSNMCSTQADNNSQKLQLPVSLVCSCPNKKKKKKKEFWVGLLKLQIVQWRTHSLLSAFIAFHIKFLQILVIVLNTPKWPLMGRGLMIVVKHRHCSCWYKNYIPTTEWGAAMKYSCNLWIFRNWFCIQFCGIIVLAVC